MTRITATLRMQGKWVGSILSVAILSFLTCTVTSAQTITGSVTGTVTDASGAVVRGAAATATNTATGISYPTVTNAAGIYSIQFLPVGPYRLVISAAGFKNSTVDQVTLIGAQEAHFDVALATGSATETVIVTSSESLLDAQDSTLSTTFSKEMVQSLPLVADNVVGMALLMPGAVQPSAQALDNVAAASGNFNPSFNVNGNREQSNNFTLDGVDINDPIDNYVAYNVSRDALQEFRIIQGNGTAEYGNANGGQVVMVTKSGTNRFHGEAFWQIQNTNLNANTWANKRNPASITARPAQNRSFFGGTFGGPVKKDKLFFFVDYRGVRQHVTTNVNSNLPDAAFGGDPAKDMTGKGGASPAYDPQTGKFYTITNPAAKYLLSHPEIYPVCSTLCNRTGSNNLGGAAGFNYTGQQGNKTVTNQGDVKIDWKASEKDYVSGRWSMARTENRYYKVPTAVTIPIAGNYPYTGFVINWQHVISPHVVNEARIGYGRTRYVNFPVDVAGYWGTSGMAKLGIPLVQSQAYPGILQVSFAGTGISPSTFGNVGRSTDKTTNAFTYADTLSWQVGKSSIKIGG